MIKHIFYSKLLINKGQQVLQILIGKRPMCPARRTGHKLLLWAGNFAGGVRRWQTPARVEPAQRSCPGYPPASNRQGRPVYAGGPCFTCRGCLAGFRAGRSRPFMPHMPVFLPSGAKPAWRHCARAGYKTSCRHAGAYNPYIYRMGRPLSRNNFIRRQKSMRSRPPFVVK